jgi:hypothetical protein
MARSNGKTSYEKMQSRSDRIREKHRRYRASKKTHTIDKTIELAQGVYHQPHFAPFAGGRDGECDAPLDSEPLTVIDGVAPTWAERVQRMADRVARRQSPFHPLDTSLFAFCSGGPSTERLPTELRMRARPMAMRDERRAKVAMSNKTSLED